MIDIAGLSSAVQTMQSRIQTEVGVAVLKQAAKADQALADMLAKNAQAAADASQSRPASKGISIYV